MRHIYSLPPIAFRYVWYLNAIFSASTTTFLFLCPDMCGRRGDESYLKFYLIDSIELQIKKKEKKVMLYRFSCQFYACIIRIYFIHCRSGEYFFCSFSIFLSLYIFNFIFIQMLVKLKLQENLFIVKPLYLNSYTCRFHIEMYILFGYQYRKISNLMRSSEA